MVALGSVAAGRVRGRSAALPASHARARVRLRAVRPCPRVRSRLARGRARAHDAVMMPIARVGEQIVVEQPGRSALVGTVLEVCGSGIAVCYRVRWEDGRVTPVFPYNVVHRLLPGVRPGSWA